MQTNKITDILLGVIALALIIIIILFFVRKNIVVTSVENTTPVNTPSTTIPSGQQGNTGSTTSTPQNPTIPAGMHQYADSAFGFSVTYPQSLNISTDSAGKITLSVPGATTNPTTITKVTGPASNGSGKFGSYTISYANNGWVVEQQNERDGGVYSSPINPIGYTTSGLPIFGSNMSHGFGMYSYIVALSHTKFLRIYGIESDYIPNGQYNLNTDPTFLIAKSVIAI